MLSKYGYDSFAGPSLNLRPDELDRLDASQLDPEVDSPSIDVERYRHLEESIDRTMAGVRDYNNYTNNYSTANRVTGRLSDNVFEFSNPIPPIAATAATDRMIPPQSKLVLTPPSSQPNVYNEKTSMGESLRVERDRVVSEIQRLCDQRIEHIQRKEEERIKQLQAEHEKQVRELQKDIDLMMHQQQQVLKVKGEMEKGLQNEIQTIRKELKREKDQRQGEKERYQKTIKGLNERIRQLEKKLASGGRNKYNRRAVSFYDEHTDDDDFVSEQARYREYDGRIEEMQREYDAKTANLVRHFEKEKASALEILKTKVRAEISLLIPRMKEQCKQAYVDKVRSVRDELSLQLRSEYEAKLRRVREEHALERRLWQRQTRELVEKERIETVQKLKAKYELKLMDIRNECERRILQRLRNGRDSNILISSDDSTNDSDLSFD